MKIIKKYWFLTFLIVVIFIGIFYRQASSQVKNDKDSFYTVKKQSLRSTLSLSGKIDAEEKVTLRFQSSGNLVWVGVKEGDKVKKYQVIATQDQREVKKNLEKELNDFLKYRWDYDQTKENNKDKAVTDAMRRILDKAQYDLNNSVLDVEIENLSIEYSNLITPIEGIVTDIASPYAGVNATATQAEFKVINPKTVYFSVSAEQTEITSLKEGMKGEIIMDAYPDETIKGEIENISFSPKSTDGGSTYEVKMILGIDNADLKYRMGMTGDVNFITKEKQNVISIPTSKIQIENDKKYIYKLENNKKKKIYIITGEENDGNTEVLKGLNENDIIL